MNAQVLDIEETIFRNSVKAVVSELKCANRFLSGEAALIEGFETMFQVTDLVANVLNNAKSMADGFSSVFESQFYRHRFHAIQQLVFNLIFKGKFFITLQDIQAVIAALELYLKPSEKPQFKQVELFEKSPSSAPEGLSGYSLQGFIFKAVTVQRLNRLHIFSFDQLYQYTQRDLFADLCNKSICNRQAAKRTISDINHSLSLRGFPELLLS